MRFRPRQSRLFGLRTPRTKEEAYFLEQQRKFDGDQAAGAGTPATPRSTIEQLQDVAELHRSGALTDDELDAAKARILASE